MDADDPDDPREIVEEVAGGGPAEGVEGMSMIPPIPNTKGRHLGRFT